MNDERQVELDCLASIFPELQFDAHNPFSFTIELPVHPMDRVRLSVSASSVGSLSSPPCSPEQKVPIAALFDEPHKLSHLPPLRVHVTLLLGYPEKVPPIVRLSTNPKWLPDAEVEELKVNGQTMWEEAGGAMVIYGILDSLQQAAENAFGYAGDDKILQIPEEFRIPLLDFDINESQAVFKKETFDCSICLEPKKGALCHQMLSCGHVFCVQCLQDFYNNAINTGDLSSVRCLAPDCVGNFREAQQASRTHHQTKKLSPSELLQIPLERDVVTRYVKLRHKLELESDKNTVYCPRKWCQGAARSKKHRKSVGLDDETSGDEESDAENGEPLKFSAGRDFLSVCEDCSFAFCARCFQGWHGEFTICMPKTATGELTEEDKASLEYLKLHTTPCPTCAAPSQKTHGCNHMICFKCNTHFCYLCSAWLSPANPYRHYNVETTGCYMRLWELEGGDGDDVGIGFAGGRQLNADEVFEVPEEALIPTIALPPAAMAPAVIEAVAPPPAPLPRRELEREGPLVLRINYIPQPTQAPAPAPAEPAQVRPNRQFRRHQNPRGPPVARRLAPNDRLDMGPGIHHRAQNAHAANAQAQIRQDPVALEEARQRWVQMFVELALNDQEDQLDWDSDNDIDDAAWEIMAH